MDFILDFYLWIKVVHIVSVVVWMAGLFYLPRLFVYHVEFPENGKMLEIMEEKLSKIILRPAMYIVILSGGLLLFIPGTITHPWVHAKLTCVFLLIMFNSFLDVMRIRLKLGSCNKSSKFFRVINEIPTILLIFIVILVIIKPF